MSSNSYLFGKNRAEKRPFCLNCGRHVGYKIETKLDEYEIRGVLIRYHEVVAVCSRCSQEVYVPMVNDINVDSREAAYFAALNPSTDEEDVWN